MPHTNKDRMWAVVAWAGVLAGGLLRVRLFLQGRSFWIDEAMLALNVGRRGLLGLLKPLAYDQAAPPLYLWSLKGLSVPFHNAETALRMPSFLAGALLLPALWLAGRRLVGDRGAALGVWIAACSPSLLYYSTEAKPYAVDALATVLILWLGSAALAKQRTGLGLALGGALAVVLSIPAVFVLAVMAAVLMVRLYPRRRGRLALTACVGTWLLTFLGCYLGVYRAGSGNAYLQQFWEGSFLDLSAEARRVGVWRLVQTVADPLPLPLELIGGRYLALILVCIGALVAFRTPRHHMAMMVGPLVPALVASLLHLYPMSPRLFLWSAPLVVVMAGAAVGQLVGWLPERGRRVSALVGVFLILGAAVWTDAWVGRERMGVGRNPREAIAVIRDGPPGIPVWVGAGAGPVWAYYTTDWKAPDLERLDWLAENLSSGGEAFRNAPPRGRPVPKGLGRNLRREFEGRVELLGLGGGWQQPDDPGSPRVPDEGWAANEWSRLAEVADSTVWLLGAHVGEMELPALIAEVRRRGGEVRAYHGTGQAWAVLVTLGGVGMP